MFLDALEKHKKNWSAIEPLFPDKNRKQLQNHFKDTRSQVRINPNLPGSKLEVFKILRSINKKPKQDWTEEENNKLVEGVLLYQKDWQKVADHVGSRSWLQVQSKTYDYLRKIKENPSFA